MARSKGEETDVAKIPPIYLRAWHNSRTCKCMTTALLPRRIENTRGIWNVKGLSEHTRPPAWRASGKLGRVYFENCPLSLSRRVTTNSFSPWISIESIVSRRRPLTPSYVRRYVVAELTLNSPVTIDRATARLLCDADRQGNEKRREERERSGHCFF